jgi:hypothetical protein
VRGSNPAALGLLLYEARGTITAVVSSLDTMTRVSAVAAFPTAVEFSSAAFLKLSSQKDSKKL